jgi:hypothetical protein
MNLLLVVGVGGRRTERVIWGLVCGLLLVRSIQGLEAGIGDLLQVRFGVGCQVIRKEVDLHSLFGSHNYISSDSCSRKNLSIQSVFFLSSSIVYPDPTSPFVQTNALLAIPGFATK